MLSECVAERTVGDDWVVPPWLTSIFWVGLAVAIGFQLGPGRFGPAVLGR